MALENYAVVEVTFVDRTKGLGVIMGQPGVGPCHGLYKECYWVQILEESGWQNNFFKPEVLEQMTAPIPQEYDMPLLMGLGQAWKIIREQSDRIKTAEDALRGSPSLR